MTQTEALDEARRRWGENADVLVAEKSKAHCRFRVWNGKLFPQHYLMGLGYTWEAAFADADRRQKEGQ